MLKKLSFFILLLWAVGTISAQEKEVYLWQDTGAKNWKQTILTPYLSENNNTGTAIIVCPGGSYFWLDMETEGDGVAKWLQSNGISAFVLKYRVAGFSAFFWNHRSKKHGNQYPDMLNDAQQAIKWVRNHAKEYHIDPNKVGIMGFSAGGHLSMSTICYSSKDERPSFAAPIYPVVTMNPPYVHKRSRRALLSERRQNDQVMRDSLSLELHVPADCPPVFLVNCVDDPIVEYHNSMLLDSALTAKNIKHKYIQYQTGGHGFGASDEKGTEE
ncbi:MAG: alpha/beta hydrolase, partial [Bacteroidales bacterium]|nr:alpha/beta hydrolase [Bacteroidales bacterium]